MQDFRSLRAWHAAQSLARDLHRECSVKSFSSYPGLRSQTLRAASSIAANIAEGAGKTGPEFARFLDMSLGAANELESHLDLAMGTGLLRTEQFIHLRERVDLVRRMLINLSRRVRDQAARRSVFRSTGV